MTKRNITAKDILKLKSYFIKATDKKWDDIKWVVEREDNNFPGIGSSNHTRYVNDLAIVLNHFDNNPLEGDKCTSLNEIANILENASLEISKYRGTGLEKTKVLKDRMTLIGMLHSNLSSLALYMHHKAFYPLPYDEVRRDLTAHTINKYSKDYEPMYRKADVSFVGVFAKWRMIIGK